MSGFKNRIPTLEEHEEIRQVQYEKVNEYEHPEEEYYFAFIDILGFKKDFIAERRSMCEQRPNRYDDVFKYYFILMEKAKFNQSKGNIYAGQTSDSLYFYTKRVDYLLQYIKIFQHFNNYAMSKNVFFRGGIAKGILHFKEEYQFYGDSVIRAYLLESVVAVNPTVVLDKKTYDELTELLADRKEDARPFLEEEEKEDRYYIKLFNFSSDPDDLKSLFIDGANLKQIDKSKIEKNIRENKDNFEYDPHNFKKYIFLLNRFKEDTRSEVGENG